MNKISLIQCGNMRGNPGDTLALNLNMKVFEYERSGQGKKDTKK